MNVTKRNRIIRETATLHEKLFSWLRKAEFQFVGYISASASLSGNPSKKKKEEV